MARFEFYFLTENYESQITYQYLTAMLSRSSLFNRNGLVADQSLTPAVYSQVNL